MAEDNRVVEVDHLVKRYRGAAGNAVDDISFHVNAGEFFALLGPNGAGKTTSISILTTTLKPTSGLVRIAGFNVASNAAQVRRHIGIIFQKPSLDQNLTAEENVRFHAVLYGLYPFRPTFAAMPRSYRDQVIQLATILGIENELGSAVKKLSGGMQRKLEIVRSLLHQPRVLFLDEPTAGLDPTSRRNLWEYLSQIRFERGTTIFLTTHYLDEAEGADRICILNHGRIAVEGSPADIKARLLEDVVVVDSAPGDRDALALELAGLGFLDVSQQFPRKLPLRGQTVHQLLRAITTPLTQVTVRTPTLEDAYVELLGGQMGHDEPS